MQLFAILRRRGIQNLRRSDDETMSGPAGSTAVRFLFPGHSDGCRRR